MKAGMKAGPRYAVTLAMLMDEAPEFRGIPVLGATPAPVGFQFLATRGDGAIFRLTGFAGPSNEPMVVQSPGTEPGTPMGTLVQDANRYHWLVDDLAAIHVRKESEETGVAWCEHCHAGMPGQWPCPTMKAVQADG